MIFNDKVAIVTGGSSGIGLSTVIEMAKRGASVLIADINEEGGNKALKEVEDIGGKAIFENVDVSEPKQIRNMVKKALSEFGRLDFAYNNAGIEGQQALIEDQVIEDVQRAFDIMINGVYISMQEQIPAIMESGGGAIVNASSIWGLNCWPEWSPYMTAKHAVSGMTKSAALEYASKGIRVNAVAPGPILTPLLLRGWKNDPDQASGRVPMRRIGRPEEVANAVCWLCSDEASFITGHILPIDGGMSAEIG
ncbi:MAG: short chain dehydrogenase [Rhodospirillaceae bacterium]|nr:short chain dehydrogenase [Rhodospirillaceae bacterium]|tara:strand:- start:9336 stop:10088 length:753 start_codon:yes stop_codon:yes gene_type:complete